VAVPLGYISDTDLGTSTFTILNRTIAQLDATPGTYTWTWGSAADQSFTIEIEATTPLPAALPLFATGLGALGLLGWRRKKKVAAFGVQFGFWMAQNRAEGNRVGWHL
jgi:hypothetical protein